MKPLEGLRVADFSHILAGPLATHFLTLQGADVVKIEAKGRGDNLRYYGPDRRYDGMAPAFINVNAGKRSIALDLKSKGGREVARRLIAQADVVVENFRPGVMNRLGFDYDACCELRPGIIFCSVSGYGQTGPYRDYPAVDNIVQGTSGMMSVSGSPGDGPIRVGYPAVDTYTGTLAAMAIISALLRRERSGKGQYIDIAMMDASIVLQSALAVPYMVMGHLLPRSGNTGYSNLPTAGVFDTKGGGKLSIGAIQQNQFEALAKGLGHVELLSDPLTATQEARANPDNRDRIRARLQQIFLERTNEEWERMLFEAGAPAGVVRGLDEAVDHPSLDSRGLKLPIRIDGLPDRQDVHVLNAGFVVDVDQPGTDRPPPRVGEHGDAVLGELGYDDAAIAALREEGAVG
ncbi:MAG TPA: CoA transferase [Sphingomonadaceae bacterium]|nr:CoA transferase [Sphingomonadaceae bacterium]